MAWKSWSGGADATYFRDLYSASNVKSTLGPNYECSATAGIEINNGSGFKSSYMLAINPKKEINGYQVKA